MKSMAKFLLWLLLFLICWPVALAALVLYPVVWVLLLPFRHPRSRRRGRPCVRAGPFPAAGARSGSEALSDHRSITIQE